MVHVSNQHSVEIRSKQKVQTLPPNPRFNSRVTSSENLLVEDDGPNRKYSAPQYHLFNHNQNSHSRQSNAVISMSHDDPDPSAHSRSKKEFLAPQTFAEDSLPYNVMGIFSPANQNLTGSKRVRQHGNQHMQNNSL